MLASYKWLQELTSVTLSPGSLADTLSSIGLEVEDIHSFDIPKHVVVGELRSDQPHPTRNDLCVLQVFDGEMQLQVVSQARDLPSIGSTIALARVGARLHCLERHRYYYEVEPKNIDGVVSYGKICREGELNLSSEKNKIFVVHSQKSLAAGVSLGDACVFERDIFEIGVTPNRPDALGHIGLSRDIAAACSLEFSLPSKEASDSCIGLLLSSDYQRHMSIQQSTQIDRGIAEKIAKLSPKIQETRACPRYSVGFVTGVTVRSSPFWMRHRLFRLGIYTHNNIVDTSNWILLETGHPIHVFDLDRIHSQIEVRYAFQGESLLTLDEKTCELGLDDLVISDGSGPIACAGVIGGKESGVSQDTKHVMIECAYFYPHVVRSMSRRLGVHTQASHRFERGVDPNDVPYVLTKALSMTSFLGLGYTWSNTHDVYPNPLKSKQVCISRKSISSVLGIEVPKRLPSRILKRLGFEVNVDDHKDEYRIKVPTYRPDIGVYEHAAQVDIVEEIARIYGYHRIPATLPRVPISTLGTSPQLREEPKLRFIAALSGLDEVVNQSFTSASILRRCYIDIPIVRVKNPLSEDRSVLRPSLLPGLLENASYGLRRQVEEIGIFESGIVFASIDHEMPDEKRKFGFLVTGHRMDWIGKARKVDIFDLKGHLEFIFSYFPSLCVFFDMNCNGEYAVDYLHPACRAWMMVHNTRVGFLGQLREEIIDIFSLKENTYYAEIDFSLWSACIENSPPAQPSLIAKTPSITRDVALVVNQRVYARDIQDALLRASEGLIKHILLFDLYEGASLAPLTKSLGFRITYQDPNRTLRDEDVDRMHEKIVKRVCSRFDATLR